MREQVSEAILDAAQEVLATRGLEGASTAAIAQRAGVAVGTLYNYFPDRSALIESLFKARRCEMLPRLTEAAREAAREPPDRRLRAYLVAVLAVFEDQREFIGLVAALDPKAHQPKGKPSVLIAAVIDGLVEILRPNAGKLAADYAQMIIGSMRALIRWRLDQGVPFTPDADLIADTFGRGMVRQ
jgi:AcrR family transcriptional regulator